MSIEQRVIKTLNSHYIPTCLVWLLTFNLTIIKGHFLISRVTIWPFDFKINRGHSLLRMYQCTKFNVCQAKGYQNIEWCSACIPTVCPVWYWTSDLLTLKSIRVSQVKCAQDIEWKVHSYIQFQLQHWMMTFWPQNQISLLIINPHMKYQKE
jgi:hypothetical protein